MRSFLGLTVALTAALALNACDSDPSGPSTTRSLDLASLIGVWDARFVIPFSNSGDTVTMTRLSGTVTLGPVTDSSLWRTASGVAVVRAQIALNGEQFVGSGPPEPCTGQPISGCWDRYTRRTVTATKDTLLHVSLTQGDSINLRLWVPISGGHVIWTPGAGTGFNTVSRAPVRLYDSTAAGVQEFIKR
jgi:hypothetical protein